MKMTRDIYAIKSKINNKYLSNLFEDSYNKIFNSEFLELGKCYFWNDRRIAYNLSKQYNAYLLICKVVNNKIVYSTILDGSI